MPGYLVSTVARSVNGHDVSGEVSVAEDGLDIEVDGSDIVVHVLVNAIDGCAALAAGRQVSGDVLVILGANYVGYRIQPFDPRDLVIRMDASYQSDGPLPPADVAEGNLSPEGIEWLDPTGEARRAGKVIRFRAEGRARGPIGDGLRSLAGRSRWSPRLRSALGLYWEGQCSDSEDTRFVLSMAALELLAQPPKDSLLKARLNGRQRQELLEKVREACMRPEIAEAEVIRLTNQLAGTRRLGAVDSLLDYLSAFAPDGFGSTGAANREDVVAWQKMRGGFLHDGLMDAESQPSRTRLVAILGVCLRAEMDSLAGGG